MIKRSDIKVTHEKPEQDSEFPHVYTATHNAAYVIRTKLEADHFTEEVADCLIGDIYKELEDKINQVFELALGVTLLDTHNAELLRLKEEIDQILEGEE